MERSGNGGLTLLKRCGEVNCTLGDYCSEGQCLPCSRICTDGSHNYDPPTCQLECQDFIHDVLRQYLTLEDSQKANRDLEESIERLKDGVTTSLVLSSIALLVSIILAFGVVWSLWQCRKGKIEGFPIPDWFKMKKKNKDKIERATPSGPPSLPPPTMVTATTPLSTRHPSEDATLEEGSGRGGVAIIGINNHCYDNPALAPSSSPNQIPRHETTF